LGNSEGTKVKRRDFLKSAVILAAGSAAAPKLQPLDSSIPVIDTHIHLFDPRRPGGVPWPDKTNAALYHPALPERYAALSQPHGVAGAIAIECSPWLVDNFWLQDVVERSPIMVGFIGDLLPEAPDFGATLDRLHRSQLFLGIRYGNLWNRDLRVAMQKPEFRDGLKLLASDGLVLETANPDPALISAVLTVSDQVPELRIVIDHLPHAAVPDDAQTRASYEANLSELGHRSNVYVKGSEIVRQVSGRAALDPGLYKASLDRMWEIFGEDRIFFGSDWPNSDSLATYGETFRVAQDYIATRSPSAQQKYFWKNSIAVYKWQARIPSQAQLHKP
jgi:predicted TIM-barrel fold metal-dependent hydrolase